MDSGGTPRRRQRPQLALGGDRLPRLVPRPPHQPPLQPHHPRRRLQPLHLHQDRLQRLRRGLRQRPQGQGHPRLRDLPLPPLGGRGQGRRHRRHASQSRRRPRHPYIADENHDEDPEVRITVKDDGPIGRALKDAFLNKGKPLILEKVRVFVEAMAKGGPAKGELEAKKKNASSTNSTANSATNSINSAVAAAPARMEKKVRKEREGFKAISMTERFNCRGRDLYEILMDENRWKGFTQSNARISKEVGGEFSLFDGAVTGTNQELQEGKLIVQKWRFSNWADGIHSTVRIAMDEPESGVTVVKLTQTGVPEEDRYGNSTVVENTERGWRDLIFNKIRAVFGFGI
ncbi:hypothetical protein Sjap_012725 [Stephania japonica]|uniref:Activator of Hsp90 ATPase homologue 1/2-like C-terminal domain-containing protein n=1 Tax=Stephania japonica TaxID=461633 RepID=A0AAP0IYC3_9MAGN